MLYYPGNSLWYEDGYIPVDSFDDRIQESPL